MRVLLIGANGQVGQEIKKQADNLELVSFSRDELDITSIESLTNKIKKHKPSLVINAAAYTSVDLAEKEKDKAYQVNALGPKILAEICNKEDILLIHISTDYVFNGFKKGKYLESDKPDPINEYGKTKLIGEDLIRDVLDKHIILRTSWVFGIYGKNFLKTIVKISRKKSSLRIVNDQIGCPTSARSIAKCVLRFCDKYLHTKRITYGTYHYTNFPETTWSDFAKVIFRYALKIDLIKSIPQVKEVSTKEYASASDKPMNSVLSNDKIVEELGLELDNWEEELEYTLNSLKIL